MTKLQYIIQIIIINYNTKVTDTVDGWTGFREYTSVLYEYLTSLYPSTLWIISSATINEESLQRIAPTLGKSRYDIHYQHICINIYRDDFKVLSMSVDRPNIYLGVKRLKKALSVR